MTFAELKIKADSFFLSYYEEISACIGYETDDSWGTFGIKSKPVLTLPNSDKIIMLALRKVTEYLTLEQQAEIGDFYFKKMNQDGKVSWIDHPKMREVILTMHGLTEDDYLFMSGLKKYRTIDDR